MNYNLITNAYNEGFDTIGNAGLLAETEDKVYFVGFADKQCSEIQIDVMDEDYNPIFKEQQTLAVSDILYKQFDNETAREIAPSIEDIIKLEEVVRKNA